MRDTSDAEMMELALVENLQRKDLTPFEEGDGLNVLVDKYGYTHEAMAEKLGKSRTTITESLSLAAMPEDIRQLCRRADIQSKSMLLQVVRQGDRDKMVAFVERLEARRREAVATLGASRRRPRRDAVAAVRSNYVFQFKPRGGPFALALQFKRTDVEREEVIEALEAVLRSLREEA